MREISSPARGTVKVNTSFHQAQSITETFITEKCMEEVI